MQCIECNDDSGSDDFCSPDCQTTYRRREVGEIRAERAERLDTDERAPLWGSDRTRPQPTRHTGWAINPAGAATPETRAERLARWDADRAGANQRRDTVATRSEARDQSDPAGSLARAEQALHGAEEACRRIDRTVAENDRANEADRDAQINRWTTADRATAAEWDTSLNRELA